MVGIYKITNPKGRVYIGQSINIERRFNDYKSRNNSYQIKLFNSFNKYGVNSHIFEIIEECLEEELNIKERYWQDHYNVLENGLNCRLTTTDDKSGKLSEETKLKLSIASKGKKRSEEHINKMKAFHIGRKRSEKSRKLMSEKAKGKIVSEETRLKQSKIRTGTKRSDETKKKMSESKKGIIFSEEHKKNISLSKRRGNHRDAKKVICIKSGKIWDCIKDCAEENNLSYAYLRNRLNGKVENKTTLKLINND